MEGGGGKRDTSHSALNFWMRMGESCVGVFNEGTRGKHERLTLVALISIICHCSTCFDTAVSFSGSVNANLKGTPCGIVFQELVRPASPRLTSLHTQTVLSPLTTIPVMFLTLTSMDFPFKRATGPFSLRVSLHAGKQTSDSVRRCKGKEQIVVFRKPVGQLG